MYDLELTEVQRLYNYLISQDIYGSQVLTIVSIWEYECLFVGDNIPTKLKPIHSVVYDVWNCNRTYNTIYELLDDLSILSPHNREEIILYLKSEGISIERKYHL